MNGLIDHLQWDRLRSVHVRYGNECSPTEMCALEAYSLRVKGTFSFGGMWLGQR